MTVLASASDPVTGIADLLTSITGIVNNAQDNLNTGDMKAMATNLSELEFQAKLINAIGQNLANPTPENLKAVQDLEGI